MRVFKYRENIPASALTDKKALDLNLRNHSSITIAMLATGANMRIKVNYIFDADEARSHVAAGGAVQPVTSATAADPCVYTSASHGYLVGDIVSVRGHRNPEGTADTAYLSGYEVESGRVTAVSTNTFTIAEHSTAGVGSFAGTMSAHYEGTESLIKQVDLTAGTLELLNFDMKLGSIRIVRGQTGSTPGAGVLRIDATATK
jgi:hypothetical protein